MTKSIHSTVVLASILTLGTGAAALAQGDSGALVDALVRKHVLTAQEGEDIRADLIKDTAASNKISISNSVSQLSLYGDVRLRYQWANAQPQVEPPLPAKVAAGSSGLGNPQNGVQQSIFRFRLRLGADIKLSEGWFAGFGLQTNNASDSANQTFGTGTNAPSAFGNYSIFIDKAFIGWHNDYFRTVLGKQSNPFYATDLTWDPDINPDGFTQSISFDKLVGGQAKEVQGYSKDGKTVVSSSSVREELPWELSLNLGEFILQTNNADAFGSDFKNDAWLLEAQLVGAWKFNSTTKLTIAPAIAAETGAELIGPANNVSFSNSGSALVLHGATRDQLFVQAPGDFSFQVAGLKVKALWDVSYNTEAAARDTNEYNFSAFRAKPVKATATHAAIPASIDQKSGADALAWLAGVQVGENKHKGDWSVFANFRQTGIAAVDPNLNDSDFALGFLNTQGVKVGVAYNITDFAVAAVTFYDFWNLRPNLGQVKVKTPAGTRAESHTILVSNGTEATAGNKIGNLNSGQLLQVDLNVKF